MNCNKAIWVTAFTILSVLRPGAREWSGTDLGAVKTPGSFFEDSTGLAVEGAGADILVGGHDFGYFAYISAGKSDDFSITARIKSLEETSSFAKAGIMVRDDLSDSSRAVFLYTRPHQSGSGKALLAVRDTAEHYFSGASYKIPHRIRLVKTGTRYLGFGSAESGVWEYIADAELESADSVYTGFAVSSHDEDRTCMVEFEDISFSEGPEIGITPDVKFLYGQVGHTLRETVSVISCGTESVTVTGISGPAGSALAVEEILGVTGAAPYVLAPGTDFQLVIAFTPVTGGFMYDTVRVTGNAVRGTDEVAIMAYSDPPTAAADRYQAAAMRLPGKVIITPAPVTGPVTFTLPVNPVTDFIIADCNGIPVAEAAPVPASGSFVWDGTDAGPGLYLYSFKYRGQAYCGTFVKIK